VGKATRQRWIVCGALERPATLSSSNDTRNRDGRAAHARGWGSDRARRLVLAGGRGRVAVELEGHGCQSRVDKLDIGTPQRYLDVVCGGAHKPNNEQGV